MTRRLTLALARLGWMWRGFAGQAADELVANIRTVRSFAQEDREKRAFAARVEESFIRAQDVSAAVLTMAISG